MGFPRLLTLTLLSFVLIGVSASYAAETQGHGAAIAHEPSIAIGELDAHIIEVEHESSGGLPQFDPSSYPSQIFWLVIVFSAMYFFFSRKTLPEISNVIENRHQHIQSDLDTAEQLREEAENAHRAYDEALDKARLEASNLFTEAERSIKDKSTREFQAFYERSSEEIKATEAGIEKAKSEAFEEMSTIAAEIAAQAAEKIIGVSTDLQKAKTIIESLHKHNKKAA